MYRELGRSLCEAAMNRRDFLAISSGVAVVESPFLSSLQPRGTRESSRSPKLGTDRQPVLVRAGFTRKPDGTQEGTTSQQTVFRSFDSEGRLAAFVVPVASTRRIAARRFICITNKMNGYTFWLANLWLKSAAGEYVSNLVTLS